MSNDKSPRRSTLYSRHEALGATFCDVDGWQMPAEFAGTVSEHRAVRGAAGMFDLSHLGKLTVIGEDPAEVLNTCLTNDVHHLTSPGKTQYTLGCDDDGGVIADAMLYRFDRRSFIMFPSGAGWLKLAHRLNDLVGEQVDIGVMHDSHSIVSVQGPQSPDVLRRIGLPAPQEYMFFDVCEKVWPNSFVCRNGLTGEIGYDITVPNPIVGDLWDALADAGAAPCGARARDSLRLEMGYPLHGTDFTEDTTAVEARLSWAIGWSKPSFWGSEALYKQRSVGVERRLFGLTAAAGAGLEPGTSVFDGDNPVATVTSAAYSPELDATVALAMFAPVYEAGADLAAETSGGRVDVRVAKPPFIGPESGGR